MRKLNSYIVLLLLLIGGIIDVRAKAVYVYENATGGSVNTKSQELIFETPVFANTDGIDYISFTYNTHSSVSPGVDIFYSTDGGANYTKLDTKSNNNGDREVENNLSGEQQNANRFKFVPSSTSTFSKYTFDVKDIKIRSKRSNNHVPYAVKDLHSIVQYAASNWESEVWWVTEDHGYKLGKGGAYSSDNYIVFSLTGIPDTAKFDIHLDNVASVLPATPISILAESADGSRWDTTWMSTNRVADEHHEVPLMATTRYVRLGYNGTIYAHFNNIEITELHRFDADIEGNVLDFGLQGAHYGEQVKTFNFEHANAGSITTAVISGADYDKFTVTPDAITGTGKDAYGSRTVKITFDNNDDGRAAAYNAILTIEDNDGHSEVVTLTGQRNGKNIPELTWNPNHVPYYFGTTINNPVVSTNTQTGLVLTSLTPSVATTEGGKVVIGTTAGEGQIQVSQVETDDYRQHTETFVIKARPKPRQFVPFMMVDTIYTNSVTAEEDCGWQTDECIRVGRGDADMWASGRYWDDRKRFVVEFGGAPDKLSFLAKNTYASIICRWKVEESSDGEYWTEVFYKYQSCKDWVEFSEIQLQPETHFLRFSYGGNYAGYFKDINVTALDGTKYMISPDGKYLSRGAAWGTRAIVDEFGTPVRISRYTRDNADFYTLVQFMDSHDYLFEAGENTVFTDASSREGNIWVQTVTGDRVTVQNATSHNYIRVENGKLIVTPNAGDATSWEVEDYTIHDSRIAAKIDSTAAAAAFRDFGAEVNTAAKVANRITDNDYEQIDIPLPYRRDDKTYSVVGTSITNAMREHGMPAVYDTTVTDLRPGLYRLTVHAFYRPAASPFDWENHADGMESVVAYIYANDAKYPLKSLFDKTGRHASPSTIGRDTLAGEYYYPADEAAAHYAFSDDQTYLNEAYVYVEADPGMETGTLHYGIANPSFVRGEWLAYEHFTLTRIARKVYVYGGSSSADTIWNKLANWEYNGLTPSDVPTLNHAVIIRNDITVTGELQAYSLSIENSAKVTIAPTGGLKVREGGIIGATTANLRMQADTVTGSANRGQTGYLRISPDYSGAMPEATMEMYSIAYFDMRADDRNNVASWQYVGSPTKGGEAASAVFPKSWVYSWDEASGEWKNNRKTLTLQPFVGYATSQYKNPNGWLISHAGQLAPNGVVELNMTRSATTTEGINVFANSYAAPIDITQMEASDFSGKVDATIYMFNTGSKNDAANSGTDAGQFISVPLAYAGQTIGGVSYPSVIPSMQGFYLMMKPEATAGETAKLTLDYKRMVWNADYAAHAPKPLRAPRYASNDKGSLTIALNADGWSDQLHLIESEANETAFENGYDARKMMSGNLNIFAIEGSDTLAVDATNSIVGTRIGVRTGEETAYTMSFSHLYCESELVLLDTEAEQALDITEGAQYTFFAEPNSVLTERFYIVEREAPAVTTGVEPASDSSLKGRAKKFIKDNQLYILKNGVLYNVMGTVVNQ